MDLQWTKRAKCKGNTEIEFFPEVGQNGLEAQRFCADCPVREKCLEYALAERIDHGVWGGLTVQKRYILAGRRTWNI
jgi:WhiB family redox-sensing transcriptional regulator